MVSVVSAIHVASEVAKAPPEALMRLKYFHFMNRVACLRFSGAYFIAIPAERCSVYPLSRRFSPSIEPEAVNFHDPRA